MMSDMLRLNREVATAVLGPEMTIMGKDQVGDTKGIVIAQHDLLDGAGRLVFSCLTRSLFACRGSEISRRVPPLPDRNAA